MAIAGTAQPLEFRANRDGTDFGLRRRLVETPLPIRAA
jgi:hypothetical protein